MLDDIFGLSGKVGLVTGAGRGLGRTVGAKAKMRRGQMQPIGALLRMPDRPKTQTIIEDRLEESAAAILGGESAGVGFMHSVLCQTSLPYRNPGDTVREWERRHRPARRRRGDRPRERGRRRAVERDRCDAPLLVALVAVAVEERLGVPMVAGRRLFCGRGVARAPGGSGGEEAQRKQGIGRALLQRVTASLEADGPGTIHLSTEAGSRAARVYAAAGWTEVGRLPNGELHFTRTVVPR